MKLIKFSKSKDWHCKLYRFAYGVKRRWDYDEGVYVDKQILPKDFCTYWWKIILAMVLLPLYFIGSFKAEPHYRLGDRIKLQFDILLVLIAAIILGIITNLLILTTIYGGVTDNHHSWCFILFFIGDIILLLVVYLLVITFVSISYISKLLGESIGLSKNTSSDEVDKSPNIFVTKFRNFKDKHCSLIEWED